MPRSIAGYRLEGLLGRGRRGAVYLAREERRGYPVALKLLARWLSGDAGFRARFLRDSHTAAELDHPHVLPIFEVGEVSGMLFLAMRYVRDGDAASLLSRAGPLPREQAWEFAAQAGSALDAAHRQGLVHGDVRPGCMLLDSGPGGGPHVFVSDFGLAVSPRPGQGAGGRLAGSADYAAPEVIEGQEPGGPSDVYSLACAEFELLCGTPPFGRAQDQGLTVTYAQLYAPPPAVTAWRPDLPEAADLVLARALAKIPAERYPTCGQFAADLGVALGLGGEEPEGTVAVRGWDRPGDVTQAEAALDGDRLAEAWPEEAAPGRGQHGAGWPGAELSAVGAGGDRPGAERLAVGAGGDWLAAERPAGEPDHRRPGVPLGQRGPGAGRFLLYTVSAAVVATAIVVAAIAVAGQLSGHQAASSPASVPRQSQPTAQPALTPATSPASSTPPPSSAARQAAAIDGLLGSSATTRTAVRSAVGQVRDCMNLPGAVSQIQQAVSQRAAASTKASALSTAAIADGATVKSDLIAALRDSLTADTNYLTWAQQRLSSDCAQTARAASAYAAAHVANQQADASKQEFVQVWNPVAARYGLPRQSAGGI